MSAFQLDQWRRITAFLQALNSINTTRRNARRFRLSISLAPSHTPWRQ